MDVALLLYSEQLVSIARRCAVLLLALAVFGFGVKARTAVYSPNPPLHITSAKLSTGKRSTEVLKSIEVRGDDSLPSTQIAVALLFSALRETMRPAPLTWDRDVAVTSPTRWQMRCVTALRRPPPLFI